MLATQKIECHFCPRATLNFILGQVVTALGKKEWHLCNHLTVTSKTLPGSSGNGSLLQEHSIPRPTQRSKLLYMQEEQHGFSDDFVPLSISSTMSSMHRGPDQQGLQGLPRSLAFLKHLKLHVLVFFGAGRDTSHSYLNLSSLARTSGTMAVLVK